MNFMDRRQLGKYTVETSELELSAQIDRTDGGDIFWTHNHKSKLKSEKSP